MRKSATEVMVPPLFLFLTWQYGSQYTGTATTIILLLGAIATLVGGKLATICHLKTVLLRCELLHLLSLFGLLSLIDSSQHLFMVCYLAKNIFFSLSLPAGETLFFTELSKHERQKAYIIDNFCSSFCMGLFSIIGFLFLKKGVKITIALAIILSLAYFLLNWLFFPENSSKNKIEGATSYSDLFKNSKFCMLSIASIAIFCVGFFFSNYFAVKISTTQGQIGPVTVDGTVFFGLLRALSITIPLLALLVWKNIELSLQEKQLYKYQLLWSAALLTLYHLESYWLMVILVCLSGMLEAILVPCRQTLLVNAIQSTHSGTYMAMIALYKRIGNMLSSLLFSFSALYSSAVWNLIITILLASGTWLLYTATRTNNRTLPPFSLP